MSHFYAAIPASARKTTPTARGHKSTGIEAYVASWNGRILTRLYHDEKSDQDRFEVYMEPHQGNGGKMLLAIGVVGQPTKAIFGPFKP